MQRSRPRWGTSSPLLALAVHVCLPRVSEACVMQSSTPPRASDRHFGFEATFLSALTLLPQHPPEHLSAWGRDLTLAVDGELGIVDIINERATYGAQRGVYLIVGGLGMAWVETERKRTTFAEGVVFEGRVDPRQRSEHVTGPVLKLELPGAGIRSRGKMVAGSITLASNLTFYRYEGTITRLGDQATDRANAWTLFLSSSVDAQLCLGSDNTEIRGDRKRYDGYCLFGAPMLFLWPPGHDIVWQPGVTFGFRLSCM
jgi:hypothetical protein